MKYTEITMAMGDIVIMRDNEDGSVTYIPKDEANSDYQRYLNPEAEESTPTLP
jgi:hypothetical protein